MHLIECTEVSHKIRIVKSILFVYLSNIVKRWKASPMQAGTFIGLSKIWTEFGTAASSAKYIMTYTILVKWNNSYNRLERQIYIYIFLFQIVAIRIWVINVCVSIWFCPNLLRIKQPSFCRNEYSRNSATKLISLVELHIKKPASAAILFVIGHKYKWMSCFF